MNKLFLALGSDLRLGVVRVKALRAPVVGVNAVKAAISHRFGRSAAGEEDSAVKAELFDLFADIVKLFLYGFYRAEILDKIA